MTADGKITVLLVEDDANVRTAVRIGLERLGFAVETANNGYQALAKLLVHGDGVHDDAPAVQAAINGTRTEDFTLTKCDADVIMLDLLMPVMDGYTFLDQYPGPVPVIVMSGLGDVAMLPRQPFALVAKPMSVVEIAETLREAAASWRAQGDPK